MSEYQDALKEELRDLDYRYAYAEDFLNTLVAIQIKVLREQRDMTQQELADLIGTKQAGISRLENVHYSAWKTETLRKIARALGVRLRITFETFGTLLDETENFSEQNLQRPSFEADPAFNEQGVSTLPLAEVLNTEAVEALNIGLLSPMFTWFSGSTPRPMRALPEVSHEIAMTPPPSDAATTSTIGQFLF